MTNEEDCSCTLYNIDYYGILSLTKNCNDLDIKKAFRRLAIQFNPERQQDETIQDIFALIAEAYEVLSDPKKRAVYDQYGEEGLKKGVLGPDGYIPAFIFHDEPLRTYRNFFGTSSPYADLLDISKNPFSLYNCPECQGVKNKGQPLIIPLQLTLSEIFFGGLKKMKIQKRILIGDLKDTTVSKEKILSIPIKPGLPTGTQIIFPEEGDQAPSIIPVDVIFITDDKPHDTFKRDGDNLLMIVDISLQEALTGTIITVSTIDNRILRVPITSIVSPDYKKILPSEGLPLVENPKKHGDLIIHFKLQFPVYLTMASRNYIKKAFKDIDANVTKDDTEYIYRFILADKMRRNFYDGIVSNKM